MFFKGCIDEALAVQICCIIYVFQYTGIKTTLNG